MLNLATIFDYSANQDPGKTAIVCGETRLTYGQLNGAVNQVANGLVSCRDLIHVYKDLHWRKSECIFKGEAVDRFLSKNQS